MQSPSLQCAVQQQTQQQVAGGWGTTIIMLVAVVPYCTGVPRRTQLRHVQVRPGTVFSTKKMCAQDYCTSQHIVANQFLKNASFVW